jgi:transcriptional regulator with XRE-family HTH domain
MTITDPTEDSLAKRIGARLRTLRKARQLTLAALSQRSGMSTSYLSAVEKGVNLPSLQTLARLTEALGVSIPSVLADESGAHVKLSRVPADPGRVAASHGQLQLDTVIVRAALDDGGPAPVNYGKHDLFVYVVEGEISVSVDDRCYDLREGDAIDATSPRSVTWSSCRESVSVWSCCPSRIH